MKTKQHLIFASPGRDAVCKHFNDGGTIRITYAAGFTILSKHMVGKMFKVNADAFSLADVIQNGYNHQGDLTLSIEIDA